MPRHWASDKQGGTGPNNMNMVQCIPLFFLFVGIIICTTTGICRLSLPTTLHKKDAEKRNIYTNTSIYILCEQLMIIVRDLFEILFIPFRVFIAIGLELIPFKSLNSAVASCWSWLINSFDSIRFILSSWKEWKMYRPTSSSTRSTVPGTTSTVVYCSYFFNKNNDKNLNEW